MFDRVFGRYLAASILALGLDFGLFMAAVRLGIQPASAAAIGYIAGVGCHWMLSSRTVFVGQLAEVGAERRQQQALFFGSALVGLGMTAAIVGVASRLGAGPVLAKAIATVVSFQVTYMLRRKVVFA